MVRCITALGTGGSRFAALPERGASLLDLREPDGRTGIQLARPLRQHMPGTPPSPKSPRMRPAAALPETIRSFLGARPPVSAWRGVTSSAVEWEGRVNSRSPRYASGTIF